MVTVGCGEVAGDVGIHRTGQGGDCDKNKENNPNQVVHALYSDVPVTSVHWARHLRVT